MYSMYRVTNKQTVINVWKLKCGLRYKEKNKGRRHWCEGDYHIQYGKKLKHEIFINKSFVL